MQSDRVTCAVETKALPASASASMKAFDRVNHDVLMGKVATRVGDRRVLGLIRRYLNAGILAWWWSGTRGRRRVDRSLPLRKG